MKKFQFGFLYFLQIQVVRLLYLSAVYGEEGFPKSPTDSKILASSTAQVDKGKAWLTDTRSGSPSMHMHGESVLAFDLSSLHLDPGLYQVGIIARTGRLWADAKSQIPQYRLHQETADGESIAPLRFKLLHGDAFRPFRDDGKKGRWGNWFGTLQAVQSVGLSGADVLRVENLQHHGGVVALWLQKLSPLNAVNIELDPQAAHHAFGKGKVPKVNATFTLPMGSSAVDLSLSIEWLDLLTGDATSHTEPLRLQPGERQSRMLVHESIPGVYRLRVTVMEDGESPAVNNPSAAMCLLATAPAKLAKDLPDDWPLGAHVDVNLPPLPGFRWYRYFAQWSKMNPQPGVYDWSSFDQVVQAVRNVGGRLFIASDGSPVWTSSRGKAGMPWSQNATAYPPDDPQVLYRYLTAMLERYADARGTLGALELCNEANTPERWLGSPADMVELAGIFRRAVEEAAQKIQLVGLAVSAGDQRNYVQEMIGAGLLDQVDAVSAHFYEEMMSHDPDTPINNLPRHVDMLRKAMREAGGNLPMINSECGVEFVPREGDRLVSQKQINARAESDSTFAAERPWMLDGEWRRVSERRAAASYVTGTVLLLANGVSRSFYFSQFQFMMDGAPSLPWVALGQLGSQLQRVDFHQIRELTAEVPGSEGRDGERKALAFLFGTSGETQMLVAWTYLQDTRVGRSMLWQPWVDPVPVRIHTGPLQGELGDLYGRQHRQVESVEEMLTLSCGEEPVFVRIPLRVRSSP